MIPVLIGPIAFPSCSFDTLDSVEIAAVWTLRTSFIDPIVKLSADAHDSVPILAFLALIAVINTVVQVRVKTIAWRTNLTAGTACPPRSERALDALSIDRVVVSLALAVDSVEVCVGRTDIVLAQVLAKPVDHHEPIFANALDAVPGRVIGAGRWSLTLPVNPNISGDALALAVLGIPEHVFGDAT